jgi:hypothetical protein
VSTTGEEVPAPPAIKIPRDTKTNRMICSIPTLSGG